MKKNLLSLLSAAAISMWSVSGFAQTRYLDEVFDTSELTVHTDVTYGSNYEVLTGAPVLIDLKMDVYEPNQAIDTETDRPLFIYIHTGNFLPIVINGSATGQRIDSTAVEMCKQWARRGYVAASIDYRLGWNPLDTTAEGRRAGLLMAVFRAIVDTKTAVRYFKKDAATTDTYRIDPDKIALFGEGSGGYVALAYATMDKFSEVSLPKFTYAATGQSYVDTMLFGNLDGFGGMFNNDNHVGYDADVNMFVNIGGALADTSWLEGGEGAFVSFHAMRDPFAPFEQGIVIVPTTQENVVEVQGANVWMQKVRDFGNNAAFANLSFSGDPYTARARSMYGQTYDNWSLINPTVTVGNDLEGLFPVETPFSPVQFFNNSSPWQWWDLNVLNFVVAAINAQTGGSFVAQDIHNNGLLSNPNMGPAQGRTYIDTIQGYMLPRVMTQFQLPGYETFSVDESEELARAIAVYPNPALDEVTVKLNDRTEQIERVSVTNVMGQQIEVVSDIMSKSVSIEVSSWPAGMYTVQVMLDNGKATTRTFVVK